MSTHKSYLFDRGFWYLLIGSGLFALKGIFIKLAYHYDVDTTELMTLRMLFSLPIYLFILFYSLRNDENQLSGKICWLAALLGFFGYYLASWLDLYALNFLPANIGRVVLYTYPTFVLLISVLFLKKSLQRHLVILLAVIYIGLLFVLGPSVFKENLGSISWSFLLGVLLTLGSGLSYAIYLVGADRLSKKMTPRFFTSLAITAASCAILLHYFSLYSFANLFEQPLPVYGYGLAIAIFSTVLPSFLITSGITRLGAEMGSAMTTVSPVFTLVFAYFLLNETLTWIQSIGFCIVLVAVYQLSQMKRG
ncbi:MAG: DMT family transporter [Cellvibrionales bacterium]|nr:DMT family transporter [Cellvibrionales bacterium]